MKDRSYPIDSPLETNVFSDFNERAVAIDILPGMVEQPVKKTSPKHFTFSSESVKKSLEPVISTPMPYELRYDYNLEREPVPKIDASFCNEEYPPARYTIGDHTLIEPSLVIERDKKDDNRKAIDMSQEECVLLAITSYIEMYNKNYPKNATIDKIQNTILLKLSPLERILRLIQIGNEVLSYSFKCMPCFFKTVFIPKPVNKLCALLAEMDICIGYKISLFTIINRLNENIGVMDKSMKTIKQNNHL